MLGGDPLDVGAAADQAALVAQREQVVGGAAGVVEVEGAFEGAVVVGEGDRREGDGAGADAGAAFTGLDVEGEFDRAVLALQRGELVEQAAGLFLQADRGEGGGGDGGVVGPGPVQQAFVGGVVDRDVEGADQLQLLDPFAGGEAQRDVLGASGRLRAGALARSTPRRRPTRASCPCGRRSAHGPWRRAWRRRPASAVRPDAPASGRSRSSAGAPSSPARRGGRGRRGDGRSPNRRREPLPRWRMTCSARRRRPRLGATPTAAKAATRIIGVSRRRARRGIERVLALVGRTT